MCTLVTIHHPELDIPVVVAANRDERLDREALAFGRTFPGEPFRAGKDVAAGGTWAGVHDSGYGVFILNGEGSLGPAPGKRSRGQLVLDLLRLRSFHRSCAALEALDPGAYRPFHLIVGSRDGLRAASAGTGAIVVRSIDPGVTMWTASGANTDASARQRAHRGAFAALSDRWREHRNVKRLFAELAGCLAAPRPEGGSAFAAMCVRAPEHGFGTRSSLIVAFPRDGDACIEVANGPPDRAGFESG